MTWMQRGRDREGCAVVTQTGVLQGCRAMIVQRVLQIPH